MYKNYFRTVDSIGNLLVKIGKIAKKNNVPAEAIEYLVLSSSEDLLNKLMIELRKDYLESFAHKLPVWDTIANKDGNPELLLKYKISQLDETELNSDSEHTQSELSGDGTAELVEISLSDLGLTGKNITLEEVHREILGSGHFFPCSVRTCLSLSGEWTMGRGYYPPHTYFVMKPIKRILQDGHYLQIFGFNKTKEGKNILTFNSFYPKQIVSDKTSFIAIRARA